MLLIKALTWTALTASARAAVLVPRDSELTGLYERAESGPVVDLGSAGKYLGIYQNNGTVASWKGIPYAEPPVGDLRFKAPRPLGTQNGTIVDVSDDALRCIQFPGGNPANVVGVKAGPGVEDCLKVWIWKPAKAKKGDKLPVSFYIHGGGLQFSAAPNNDFSDWVSQDQNFIAVNVAYRLGALGFMASEELTKEGENANAGFLDARMALKWVKNNIAEFGGDPNEVTIMGQSGGGYAIIGQLALYDGKTDGLFKRAIPRSIQRSPMFKVSELSGRNAAYAQLLNCSSSESELACFRRVSPAELVNAATTLASQPIYNGRTYGQSAAFLPMIDGVTLTDTLTQLFKKGKVASVPVIAGAVNDEGANTLPKNTSSLTVATNGIWGLDNSTIEKIISFYPVNQTYGYASPDNFFLSVFKAAIQSVSPFGEGGITGSERLVGRYMSNKVGQDKVWTFRFDAPTVGTTTAAQQYPLNWVAHSADNSYLQNATSVMTDTEKAMAYEWRAYIGSFIRTGNPNTQKLSTARTWYSYGSLGNYVDTPTRLVPTFAFVSNANTSLPTSTQPEIAQRAQIEREDFWLSDAILNMTRL